MSKPVTWNRPVFYAGRRPAARMQRRIDREIWLA
jgi:hypothetical protein